MNELENIKASCLNGMDFEKILAFYGLYVDVTKPDCYKLLSEMPVASSVLWEGKPLTVELLKETAEHCIDTLLDPNFAINFVDNSDDISEYNVSHGGFTVEALNVDCELKVVNIELKWTPLVSESLDE